MSTFVLVDDLKKYEAAGDALARSLLPHWKFPLQLVFLNPDCSLVTKLNYFRDLPGIHPDVAYPPRSKREGPMDTRPNDVIFLEHLAQHFGRE
ncbi:MAG: hypothetical protein HY040_27090 [Planctomycetes bacterium]|nr:hypothetical protein [Planctomycetota bacterium]